MNKVEAQQARRILDRLVGYQVSPFLWKPIRPGLSAGRVQTVALRLICEREDEIRAIREQEYWSITAHLERDQQAFDAKLHHWTASRADPEQARRPRCSRTLAGMSSVADVKARHH
jgi:DNA topoisomerase-1